MLEGSRLCVSVASKLGWKKSSSFNQSLRILFTLLQDRKREQAANEAAAAKAQLKRAARFKRQAVREARRAAAELKARLTADDVLCHGPAPCDQHHEVRLLRCDHKVSVSLSALCPPMLPLKTHQPNDWRAFWAADSCGTLCVQYIGSIRMQLLAVHAAAVMHAQPQRQHQQQPHAEQAQQQER